MAIKDKAKFQDTILMNVKFIFSLMNVVNLSSSYFLSHRRTVTFNVLKLRLSDLIRNIRSGVDNIALSLYLNTVKIRINLSSFTHGTA